MPILIALIVLSLLIYFALRHVRRPDETASLSRESAHPAPPMAVAWLANGNIYYEAAGTGTKQIHSLYIQEVTDRLEKSRALHAWKKDTAFGFTAHGGVRDFDPDGAKILATSALFDGDQRLVYFLRDEGVGGLFAQNLATGDEQRLLLKSGLHLADLHLDRQHGKILCSSLSKNGTAAIAILNCDGSGFRELTGGDTFDSAPTWIAGWDNKILFQSAGLARDAQGYLVAQGNASLQMLDIDSGKLSPVLDDSGFDYLHPRVCPRGNLHFIRRPYQTPRATPTQVLEDIVFFPFRLLRAVFHYLNFFSVMYTRKPLTSASGPATRADIKEILLKGKRIDAEKALREERRVHGVPSLVPHSWQLIRRDQQGNEEVLACNVLSYDLLSDGRIVYSNGRGAFLLNDSGDSRLILQGDLIGDLAALPIGT